MDPERISRRDFAKRGALGGIATLFVPGLLGAMGLAHERTLRTGTGMGTSYRLTAVGGGERVDIAIDGALSALARVDRLMSVHRSESDLGRLNLAGGAAVQVDPATADVARAAIELAKVTDGALDPTVTPIVRRWGFDRGSGRSVDGFRLRDLLDRVGYEQIRVSGNAIELARSDCEIDFGGIAKGYGVDRAIGCLHDATAGALIEAGGDLFAAGRPSDQRRWEVGIRDPRNPARVFAAISVEDEAVATSGGYEQARMVDGRPVSHLIDPRTGDSATGVISSTIVAPTTMEADALSTATYVLGVRRSLALVHDRPGVEGVWVDDDGRTWISPGLRDRIRFI